MTNCGTPFNVRRFHINVAIVFGNIHAQNRRYHHTIFRQGDKTVSNYAQRYRVQFEDMFQFGAGKDFHVIIPQIFS